MKLFRTLLFQIASKKSFGIRQCSSMFGLQEILQQDTSDSFKVVSVKNEEHELCLDLIKRYYLPEHVLVKQRQMDLFEDRALDEYVVGLLKQGNTLLAKAENGTPAGICVNFASSPADVKNLRSYAYYRQDPNTKDFLYFNAKLQETPNLWELFKVNKIFEIKMLAVMPEFRRQGLAVTMVEKAKQVAQDQGYHVIRLDCINPNDYKVAERSMFQCLLRFPLHKLRGLNAPFIKRSSTENCYVRIYVDHATANIKHRQLELENLIE